MTQASLFDASGVNLGRSRAIPEESPERLEAPSVQISDNTQVGRILERLRQGAATRMELFCASGSLNTTGRISELRKLGYRIECDKSGEHPVYRLTEEP